MRPALYAAVVAACLTFTTSRAAAQTTLQTQVDRLAAALRKADSTIKKLEVRVAKLESDAERDDQDLTDEAEKAEEAKDKANIERRLSALERGSNNKSSGDDGVGRTVRAPFVVENADGTPILRVTGGTSPRVLVGVEKGGGVELGTGSAGGGIVRVRDASNADRVILIASNGLGQLRVLSTAYSAVLSSTNEERGASLGLFKGDVPTARMSSGLTGYGSLLLSDPSGTEHVFAGLQKRDACYVGVVMTGPRRRPGTMGPPSLVSGAC